MKFILLSLIFCSCSSMKKTLIYSSLAGGLAGTTMGIVLFPNPESRLGNALVFGGLGAGSAAFMGYLLYRDDPRNYHLKSMLLENRPQEINLPLGNLNIRAVLQSEEAYKLPVKKLPPKLKGKVGKQYLIRYKAKERYIKQGGKTYYIPEFEIYEHSFEKLGGELE